MENGPFFGDASNAGDTIGWSWKEALKACVHHPSLLRLNRTFLCVLVQEKLWVIQFLDFEYLLSKPE